MRDYGLGNYTEYVVGRPKLDSVLTEIGGSAPECPNCKIACLCEIKVLMKGMPLMSSKYAEGRYLSCPACPWASPMMCVGVGDQPPDWWTKENGGGK